MATIRSDAPSLVRKTSLSSRMYTTPPQALPRTCHLRLPHPAPQLDVLFSGSGTALDSTSTDESQPHGGQRGRGDEHEDVLHDEEHAQRVGRSVGRVDLGAARSSRVVVGRSDEVQEGEGHVGGLT